ncbi:hypothetical protein BDR04DRAFT_861887 [Suillus decipiens]|nr:hypothetical protein BDR04DRAFT_861887 [Suillus decipiens]
MTFDFSWTTHIFSGFRILSLRGTGNTSFPTLLQFLQALKYMPALEQLGLQNGSDTNCSVSLRATSHF